MDSNAIARLHALAEEWEQRAKTESRSFERQDAAEARWTCAEELAELLAEEPFYG